MPLITDTKRARKVAEILYKEFNNKGIHGRKDMPEDLQPKRTSKGSLEHILFITLTVSIDYQRDAVSLWANSRKTFEDASTRYLFSPQDLYETEFSKIVKDMQKHKLSKKVEKDARIWKTIGVAFYKKWNSNPLNFLKDCKWDSLVILDRLKKSFHIENNKYVPDYPYL
ncbi:MAG: hypothetical protein K9L84_05200, partial [Candidatus Omnitrophica bacterium]|nr:hypothetical protein [Candidatus Omnitrophota bacterium]